MASIPGVQFNLTGASGSQALLSPQDSYRTYVFPRGAWAAQDSTGTLITFDTAAIASRFAANDWIQVGIATANIRKVSAVGGNSVSVSGAAVTVTEDTRVFLVGQTQPSTSGGSTTYTIPASVIRHRDDDTSDLYTNSMVTSNSDGLIRFYGQAGLYDCLIQDGNQSPQGYIADLPVGIAEGVSTSLWAVFGATATFNAAVGVSGFFTGNTVTVHRALGVTGWATFGASVTINGALGVTGHAVFGASGTFNANVGVTGTIIGTTGTFSQTLGTSRHIVFNRLVATQGTSLSVQPAGGVGVTISGWASGTTLSVQSGSNDVRGAITIVNGTSATTFPNCTITFTDGAYTGQRFYLAGRNGVADARWVVGLGGTGNLVFTFGSDTNVPLNNTAYSFTYICVG